MSGNGDALSTLSELPASAIGCSVDRLETDASTASSAIEVFECRVGGGVGRLGWAGCLTEFWCSCQYLREPT